jgi:hypothetical protein
MSFDKQGEKLTAAIIGAAVRFDISHLVDREEGRFLDVGASVTTVATFTPYPPVSGGTSQYPEAGVRAGASLSAGNAF